VQKVIPLKSKTYRPVAVNHVDITAVLKHRSQTLVHAGLAIGKQTILCTLRWGPGDLERPWRIGNPDDLTRLADLLQAVAQGRQLLVALEPTGTYGDPLRYALQRVGLHVQRVSPKAASDYAEVFDGAPSQHDGKEAGVVAALAAQGRRWPWPLPVPTEDEQELAYHVEGLDGQRRLMLLWCGRREALLRRHWPEATRRLKLNGGVLLRCLARYGGPRSLAADPEAAERVRRWGKGLLAVAKAEALVASARQTAGGRGGAGTRNVCVATPLRCRTASARCVRRVGVCVRWRKVRRQFRRWGK
jgi:transposase